MPPAIYTPPKRSRLARLASISAIVIGAIFVTAGAGTWFLVSDTLRSEGITVSDNAEFLAGAPVADPLTAYFQADVIKTDALEGSGGLSYAELDRDDPERESAMKAASLRTALYTSVISFGIALFAIGVGAVAILLGGVSLAIVRARFAEAREESYTSTYAAAYATAYAAATAEMNSNIYADTDSGVYSNA